MNNRRHIADPEAFRVALPQLAEGEHYIGAVGDQHGNLHHVILLPGDHDDADWKTQMEWAKSIGGDLPGKTELAMLWGSSRDQLQRQWYWSNQEHELDSSYAWSQVFLNGDQFHNRKGAELRARAVRRVPVQRVGEQRAPAAGDACKPDLARAEDIAADFMQHYEWRGEDVAGRDTCYTPNRRERAMINDAVQGLLAEPEFIAAIAGRQGEGGAA